MLDAGLQKLEMLKEDCAKMAAKDLHELLRCWENFHRVLSVEAHARHILFREESRYPGYYYRGDFNKIDDANWKCFGNSKYDVNTNTWELKKVPYVQIFP
jgi:adenylylsulfate reductase subunit A